MMYQFLRREFLDNCGGVVLICCIFIIYHVCISMFLETEHVAWPYIARCFPFGKFFRTVSCMQLAGSFKGHWW